MRTQIHISPQCSGTSAQTLTSGLDVGCVQQRQVMHLLLLSQATAQPRPSLPWTAATATPSCPAVMPPLTTWSVIEIARAMAASHAVSLVARGPSPPCLPCSSALSPFVSRPPCPYRQPAAAPMYDRHAAHPPRALGRVCSISLQAQRVRRQLRALQGQQCQLSERIQRSQFVVAQPSPALPPAPARQEAQASAPVAKAVRLTSPTFARTAWPRSGRFAGSVGQPCWMSAVRWSLSPCQSAAAP